MANKFTLRGHHIEVDYTIGANPAFPALIYKQGSFSKSFIPSEIRTDSTALGSLVSVPLARSIDAGGTTFAFFLPEIEVPGEQTVGYHRCHTGGIQWTELRPAPPAYLADVSDGGHGPKRDRAALARRG